MRFLLLALLVAGVVALACGPFFQVAVFSYARHPDFPRTAYADGKLGVLLPSYARSYLVVAYRHINGTGFDAREREQLLGYWTDRETGHWDHIETSWRDRWDESYARLTGARKPEPKKLTGGTLALNPETNAFALNCADDAFRNALHTLDARSTQFGKDSGAVKDWAAAQHLVFENCDGDKPVIPPSAAADMPEILRKDRDYQVAAAHFYAGQYDDARAGFESIAQDAASPWSTLAPYLVARTLFRAGQESDSADKARAILADSRLTSIHGMTWALLRRMMVQQKDDEYFHQLSTLLQSRGQGNGLREELWEFTRLYDGFVGYDPYDFGDAKKPVTLPPLERDDLPDWIATWQGLRDDAAKHAYDRWHETRQPQWLLAALARAQAKTPQARELIDAAGALNSKSPAYQTAAFHRMRLTIDAGQGQAIRPELDALLARGGLSKSGVNLFKGLRMRVSTDLGDFLRFAQRVPVLLTTTDDIAESGAPLGDWARSPKPRGPFLDSDAALVLNQRTPLALWKDAAERNAIPQVTLAAFTRAVVLGADDTAQALAARLPQTGDVKGFLQETTPEGRRFAGAFVLLHLPESRPYVKFGVVRETAPGRIDSFRDNWWCEDERTREKGSAPPEVAFLTAPERDAAAKEYRAIVAAGGGSRYLGRVVLAWAKVHPDDPRVPEALHRAVRANRYACDAGADWPTTRDAFRLLHRRYPTNEWTARTPVWNQ